MEKQVIHALISTEEYRESPDFMNVNLSDFALFLTTVTCPQRRDIHHPDRSLWHGPRHVYIHGALAPDSGDGTWG